MDLNIQQWTTVRKADLWLLLETNSWHASTGFIQIEGKTGGRTEHPLSLTDGIDMRIAGERQRGVTVKKRVTM